MDNQPKYFEPKPPHHEVWAIWFVDLMVIIITLNIFQDKIWGILTIVLFTIMGLIRTYHFIKNKPEYITIQIDLKYSLQRKNWMLVYIITVILFMLLLVLGLYTILDWFSYIFIILLLIWSYPLYLSVKYIHKETKEEIDIDTIDQIWRGKKEEREKRKRMQKKK